MAEVVAEMYGKVEGSLRTTLSADHRASDGHDGARLLAAIDHLLQDPEAL